MKKKKSLLTASLQQLGGKKKKKGTDKGGGFFPSPPLRISPPKCQLNCSIFFSRFSDSAGKDLQSVWEEAPLTVPAAGQEVAKATLQLPGGVPLPPTQIKGLIPFLLPPRTKPVVTPAGVRPRQVFGTKQVFCGFCCCCCFDFFFLF